MEHQQHHYHHVVMPARALIWLREHPFNLKVGAMIYLGGGGWGGDFLSANFMEKFFSVSDMDRNKYSESTYALKNIVFVEKK